MKHNIQLSDHFTYKRLLRFVFPSIMVILFTSIYSIVDGFFVSNYAGKTPFAALNLIYPVLMIVGASGFMIGTGGSAIVSARLGAGKEKEARQIFTMLVYVLILAIIAISIVGFVCIRPIALFLGATEELLPYCVLYARVLFCSMPFFTLQFLFQSFFVVAEKPGLSLKISIASGIINVILDFLLVGVLSYGLFGAAIATAAGQIIGGIAPIIYFARKNNGTALYFVKAPFRWRIVKDTCINGSSEMVTNLAASVVSMLYNFQLLKLVGEDGVSAYGILMYVNFIFASILFGYAVGSAPIVSYNFGAKNKGELQNMFRMSLRLLTITGLVLFTASEALAVPLSYLFAGYDETLLAMTIHGFRIYNFTFLVFGFNVWGSALFTALNNGVISAILSFMRTFVLSVLTILLLPHFFGINGVWAAAWTTEVLALFITAFFIIKKRRVYEYYNITSDAH